MNYRQTTAITLAAATIIGYALSGCEQKVHEPKEPTKPWRLTVCAGISSWGCGMRSWSYYDTKEECLSVMESVRVEGSEPRPHESERRRDILMYCTPTPR